MYHEIMEIDWIDKWKHSWNKVKAKARRKDEVNGWRLSMMSMGWLEGLRPRHPIQCLAIADLFKGIWSMHQTLFLNPSHIAQVFEQPVTAQ